jgi:hypothetical protein
VADVLAGGVEGYAGRVEQWARSIVRTLDAAEAEPAAADVTMNVKPRLGDDGR